MAAKTQSSQIRVDMFEVGLGSAILLQLRSKTGEPTVVLADAGVVRSGGRQLDHVHKKLDVPLTEFGSHRRIDLMIGTHYDADHLEGLVPIVEDKSIKIGEAWMPPVANDTEVADPGAAVTEESMLGYQFAEGGEEALSTYLSAKLDACEQLTDLESSFNRSLAEAQGEGEPDRPYPIPESTDQLLEALGRYATRDEASPRHDETPVIGPPPELPPGLDVVSSHSLWLDRALLRGYRSRELGPRFARRLEAETKRHAVRVS